ncbi:T9SS type A sorting domain-containing protein [Phaeodactylibacter xiamenensis]|uniref:T9SS type A sorting domain-containing protein n=1 Tax=Phaeodactylibacter xiamenensis TaxID=1524460 RepID=UPI003BA890D3
MKWSLFCAAILSATITTTAQVEWALDESFPDSIKTFVVSQRGEHLLNFTHKVSPTPQPDVIKEHKLVVSDEEDPEIFFLAIQETHDNGATLDISDVIELPDSTFVIPHITGWVDDQGWISVWRYFDYFGTTWNSAELFCFNSFSHDLTGPTGDAFPTGEIALLGPEAHFNFNNAHGGRISYQSCQPSWESFFEFQVQDQTITSGGRLIYTGPTGLYTISAQGVPTAHFPQWHFSRIEPNPYNGIIGYRHDSLFALTPDFEILQAADFTTDPILDFSTGYGKVAVLTQSQQAYIFNDSLQLQGSFPLNEDSEFWRVDVGAEYLGLAGLETFGSDMPTGGTEAFFSTSYTFEGEDFGLDRDLGVIGYQLGAVLYTQGDPAFPGFSRTYFDSVVVQVQNFGDEAVSRFKIRSGNRPARFAYDVEGQDLLPGNTLQVTLSNFWIHTEGDAGDLEPVCFWTSHPDDKTDANSGNDGTCADFVVSTPPAPEAIQLKVFPNPAQDRLFIDWGGSGTATCRIIHPTGQIIEQFVLPVQGNNPLQVNLSPYPTGMYILSLQTTEGESAAKRFIIAR